MPTILSRREATLITSSCHRRQHRSLLAAAEKRLLVRIAARLPAAVTSDHLSILGLVSMAVAGAAFAAAGAGPWSHVIAAGALAANWFGDSLDGTVARVRDQQRPRYGFYVDHVIDLVGTTFLLGGLACSPLMHPIVALALLGAYLLVASESFLGTHAAGVFRMSFAGWGPTELRIVLAAGTLTAISKPFVSLGSLGTHRLFDVGGAIAIAALAAVFVISAARQTRALWVAEPLPPAKENGV